MDGKQERDATKMQSEYIEITRRYVKLYMDSNINSVLRPINQIWMPKLYATLAKLKQIASFVIKSNILTWEQYRLQSQTYLQNKHRTMSKGSLKLIRFA